MNQTDAIAATPADGTAIITTAHLIIIILLAIAAMLIIWWGGRRRARERAEREASQTETVVAGETFAPPPVAPPVTPPPPPLVNDPVAAPAPAPAPEPAIPASRPAPVAAAATGEGDAPVTLLKGLGPKVAARLGELGITTVAQLAALSPAEADALDADLGAFRGRMARDRWVEQAQLLAAGDRAGYEATFGKLG